MIATKTKLYIYINAGMILPSLSLSQFECLEMHISVRKLFLVIQKEFGIHETIIKCTSNEHSSNFNAARRVIQAIILFWY